MITTPSEVAMGESVHQSVAKKYKFSNSPQRLERLRRIGERLTKVSDRQDYQYRFYLLEEDAMNAFTTPGGNIYVYTGLLDQLKTDDQLASVLAHEIGHCAARHTVKKFQAALGYNIVSAVAISQITEDQARRITAISANAVMSIVFSSYSRRDEYEADRLGLKYLRLACFEPQAVVETFSILEAKEKDPPAPLILRSHPYLDDRIQRAEQEIKTLDGKYAPRPCPDTGAIPRP